MTLRPLLLFLIATSAPGRIAFGVEDNHVSGAPGWIETDAYDIDAKTAAGTAVTTEDLPPLLQSLLRERFQFRFHRDRPAPPSPP